MNEQSIKNFSNNELVKSLEGVFETDRKTSHIILLHLKEIEIRKAYADFGFPDLFTMLIQFFRQSETAANQRIYALRLIDDVPEIKNQLITGELNLSTLAMTQRQIQREEKITGIKLDARKKAEIVQQISGKTIHQTEKELMTLLPESSKTLETQERRISKDEIRLSISIPDRVKDKMERLKNRWAAVNPRMDYLELIERSLDIALAIVDPIEKEKQRALKKANRQKSRSATEVKSNPQDAKKAQTTENMQKQNPTNEAKRNRSSVAQDGKDQNATQLEMSEPAEIQPAKISTGKTKISKRKTYYSVEEERILWTRANSQCEFIDERSQRRCPSKFGPEKDHIIPLALGGTNDIENLRLLCRTHNQLMARRHFGAKKIQREIHKR